MKLVNKVKVKLPTIYTLFEEGEQINNIASKVELNPSTVALWLKEQYKDEYWDKLKTVSYPKLKECSVQNCTGKKSSIKKGLCPMHYRRMNTYGTTDARYKPSLQERLLNNIKKTDTCWEWTGRLDRNGYGIASKNKKNVFAHRVSLEIFGGEKLNPDLHVDHLCYNKRCVNPKHLEQVTPMENVQRAIRKGVFRHTVKKKGI